LFILELDTHTHGLFSRTTWVSRHQKGQTNLDFNQAREDAVAVASAGPYANHLTDKHVSTSPLKNFFTSQMLFLTSNQQCQSTEGITLHHTYLLNK